jgi:ribosomal protein L24
METITTKCDYERDFTGCVLSTREYNGYHDSDFYATVWDEEMGCVREIEDGTTRCYAPSKYSRADASEEVRAKARNWYASNAGIRASARIRLERAFNAIRVGDEVEVVAGRKIVKGTKGEVVWVGRDSFNPRAYRVGMRLIDGSRVFTAMGNLEKLNVMPPTEAEIDAEVQRNNPY